MKAKEIKSKSEQELKDLLVDLRKEQFELRMQLGTGQLTEPHKLRQVRRDIARVKTVLNQPQGEQA
ncbi:50S ribosomal protein L29 [Wenzhouxiangella sp. XN79A]|uniref:50S ribosomal protein L29 n=1 Tax=Wenzhouxiangella sp. XN79A TaxID=2724193 RepID=UPI00144AA8CE|nr:50S ribosomal protein L29 [Wenzhouxiangella sp. XN79A]NKI33758.1 50S ribosomal protein L29 [Wenzhouxiangella sp. XN79A]